MAMNKCRRKGGACQKEERVRSIYSMALMASKIYDAGWGYSRDIAV